MHFFQPLQTKPGLSGTKEAPTLGAGRTPIPWGERDGGTCEK
jgi:hypothetical protein